MILNGLRRVHSDGLAANIYKLRQCRRQQPLCLAYIVLDDRLPVIDCNMICECSVSATREGSPLAQKGGLPSREVAPTNSQCCSADFVQWNARVG